MATPYINDAFPGTVVFPLDRHVAPIFPEFVDACNNLYYVELRGDSPSQYPWPYDGGTAGGTAPAPTTMCDLPEALVLANHLKGFGPAPDENVVDQYPPYVNPAGCSEPDIVYALNFLYDVI